MAALGLLILKGTRENTKVLCCVQDFCSLRRVMILNVLVSEYKEMRAMKHSFSFLNLIVGLACSEEEREIIQRMFRPVMSFDCSVVMFLIAGGAAS